MAWTKQLSQLRDALAVLIPFREDVIPYLNDAEINWTVITLPQNPVTLWFNILSFAEQNQQLDELVEVLLKKFPKNPHLLAFKQQLDYSTGPDIDVLWKPTVNADTLQKVTGVKSTLLPISFLRTGLERARSVARIMVKTPGGMSAGTGFLLANNYLITNNHVIQDEGMAAIAKIQFGVEQSAAGVDMLPTDFTLDPAKGFATSKANDWTAIKINGDANKDFGAIDLVPVTVEKDEFVNIIQHPGGQSKQIGMYHNIVTFVDNNIVQYLTDTEPGSSGAPVFNSDWEVVALHHSGGMLKEPGAAQKLLRNEGININVVIADLKEKNLP